MQIKNFSTEAKLILAFVLLKLTIHFLTNTNYDLHRDAFLYLALGDHLDFGYMSVPPMIAFLAKFSQVIFGDSTFSVRLLPAVIGAVSVGIIGQLVKELGGKTWAIVIACSAFTLSPAFLRSNTLFQPVSFNQFCWLLLSYFVIKLVLTGNLKHWFYIGLVIGFGFLTKYSILFLVAAYLVAFLISPYRRMILSKEFVWGVLIALAIMSPNLIWQALHNWPVVAHMAELQQTQLVNVSISGFISAQFLMNIPVTIVWIWGLAFLFFNKEGKPFRFVGYTFLLVIVFLLLLRGKPYYMLGIYSTLFAFGGLAIEHALATRLRVLKPAILAVMLFLTLVLLPFSLPVLTHEQMVKYCAQTKNYGSEGALRWEDGKLHNLPQDYADMTGWKELAEIVIAAYRNLEPEERAKTVIYGESYGHAGAIKHYGKKYGLPEPVSFSGSFLFWAPDTADFQTLIYVNDEIDEIRYFFEEVTMLGRITDKHARERGTPVWICKNPRNDFHRFYSEKVKKIKGRFTNETLITKFVKRTNNNPARAL